MPHLSQRTLAKIQNAQSGLYDDTCLLEAENTGLTAYGLPVAGFVTVAANVPIRLIRVSNPTATTSETTGGENTMRDSYRMITPISTPLASGQRVTIASTGDVFWIASIQSDLTDRVNQEAFITRQRGQR